MKVIKMLNPDIEKFDSFLQEQLNNTDVDTSKAGMHMQQMQWPVSVVAATTNAKRIKFFFLGKRFILLALLSIGTISAFFLLNKNNSNSNTNSKVHKTTNDNSVANTNVAKTLVDATDNKNIAAYKNISNNIESNTAKITTVNDVQAKPMVSNKHLDNAITSSSPNKEITTNHNVLTTSLSVPKPALGIDSIQIKPLTKKLDRKQDTVDVIW